MMLFREALLLPIVAGVAAGTGYFLADADGAFPEPAGHGPPQVWLAQVGFLALGTAVVVCPALALISLRERTTLGCLLPSLCAAYFVAFSYSYDDGADDEVPRYVAEHPFLSTWIWIVIPAALVAVGMSWLRPRVGLTCTSAVAVLAVLPMIGTAIAGH
jgi:hypothetical protein